MRFSCLCAPEGFEACRRPALVLGHPGHELRVFGWVSEYKPLVSVITDGSGRSAVSRIPSTNALLDRMGASPSSIFGVISDAGMYDAILQSEASFFLGLLDRIAESLIANHIDFVAGDASEGFNPSHDLNRALVNAAVVMVRRATGISIANFEFCLTEWEHGCQEQHDGQCWHLLLSDSLLEEKLAAAEQYVELKEEVRIALAARGKEHFRLECLKKVSPPLMLQPVMEKPFYETWGEQRMAQGAYRSVIRYKQHMLPILQAIYRHAMSVKMVAA